MCPEKPVLLMRCANTQEKLWCDEGPKIRTPTITITPPSIHQAEIRFSSETRCEEKTLIRLWTARMRKNRMNVLCRIVEVLRRREVEDEVELVEGEHRVQERRAP